MTDQDIERIARRLCAIRGDNPDGDDIIGQRAWMYAAAEVRAFHEVATAFRLDAQPGDLTVPAVTVPR